MNELRAPTHRLVITIPLDLTDRELDYHPVEETLRVVLSVSRLAVDGVVADDVHVSLDEVTADATST